jgi:hypothetical protein
MSVMGMGGGNGDQQLLAEVADATGLAPEIVRQGLDGLVPEISATLSRRLKEDASLAGRLSALLATDSGAEDEATFDGRAILAAIYGSQKAASAAMKRAASGLPASALAMLAPISAVAATAASLQPDGAMTLTGAASAAGSGGGILGTFINAVIAGAIQGALRQVLSKRRSSSRSQSSTKRRKTTKRKSTGTRKRRSSSASALEDILGGILGTKRK